jgi:hypothetical protein
VKASAGKVRRVAGPPVGKEDGFIPVQKGEFVIKKAAVKKLGTKALDQVNRGRLPKGKRE